MPQERKGRNGGTLKAVAPGEVKNPKGRGKGTLNTKTVLNKWLAQVVEAKNPATKQTEKMTALDMMTLAMVKRAMDGDVRAYTALLDRLEGRPRQAVELTGKDGDPIKAEVQTDPIDYDALDSETLRKIAAARKPKHG